MDRPRSLPENRYDVVVVGAGTGGLTAAALLARSGKNVLVIDQHSVAGGNATLFRRTGYEFDVGLHYLGDCSANGLIPRVLRYAGADPVEFLELDPDGFDTFLFPDFTFRMPRGIEEYERRLHAEFPRERRAIGKWVALIRQIDRFQTIERKPWTALWVIPRSLLLIRSIKLTLREFWAKYSRDERLLAVFAGQSGDYALPPSRASVGIAAGICEYYLHGAGFPKGGGQKTSDALAGAIEKHGGKILLLARATRIVVEGGRVKGVEFESRHLGARFVEAPVVISNADLKKTVFELVGGEHFAEGTRDATRGYEMAPALAVAFVGMKRDLVAEGHPRTNYWIFPGCDHERLYAAAQRGEFCEDAFAYISIASVKDPANRATAPDGITNLQVMGIAPSQPEAWGVTAGEFADGSYRTSETYRARKREFAEQMLDAAERVFPDIREQIDFLEVATPLTHSRYTLSTGGTSYGIAATPAQFLFRRPSVKTGITGLFLCGASTKGGHGIAGVMTSGVMAAAKIAGNGLWRAVMGAKNDV